VLPPPVLDGARRVQYLHLPSQRKQERGQVHEDGMPGSVAAPRAVHAFHRLPCRGRPEHLRVPLERLEERGRLHQHEMPDADAGTYAEGA